LQKQVDFLDAHPKSAMCCHRAQYVNEISDDVAGELPSLPAGPYAIEDLLKDNFIVACSAVVRRNLIGRFPRWLSRMKMADWPLFAFVASHGNIELMDETMATYRIHSGGIWSPLSFRTRQRETVRMLKALDEHFGYQYKDTIREAIARPYLELAMAAQVNGERTETAKHLYTCLRNGGWQFRGSRRTMLALAAYALIGPRYKVFSRAKSISRS
jgi:predicted TIM-barrel fold metal-dependent hydrolase